ANFAALPEPKEKDATPGAYREVVSEPGNASAQRFNSPKVSVVSYDLPSRTYVTVASLPAAAARTCAVRSVAPLIGRPLNAVMMSPFLIPASAAAPPLVGSTITAPVTAADLTEAASCTVAPSR